MKKLIVVALVIFGASAEVTAPVLTDTQKLQIRDLQLEVATLDAQKFRLEAQYRDLTSTLEKKATELSALVAKLTPSGYTLQSDLKLIPATEKKPAAEKQ